MKIMQILLIILAFLVPVAYATAYVKDTLVADTESLQNSFETEYGKANYCYTTDDNFLICKLGE